MAEPVTSVDGVDKILNMFPAVSAKLIERILERAREIEALRARRAVVSVLNASGSGRAQGGLRFAHELGKALRIRGDLGRGRPSIRQRGPSGGSPFHFAYSVARKDGSTTTVPRRNAKPTGKAGTAQKHMRYIERDDAVERVASEPLVVASDGSWDREIGADRTSSSVGSSAAAAQIYADNPSKIERSQSLASFGTIGETRAEREHFWGALEEAEPRADARVQHRLIIELPHQASPSARLEIMKEFCKRFEGDNIPYWTAIHAPGPKNDSRNFHAHVVYSERPAVRMVDSEDPEQKLRWDFEIIRVRVKKSRNRVSSRPFRQKKLRSYHDEAFIPERRKSLSEIANVVLSRDDVRDLAGDAVRYDPRTYKAMGVHIVPIRSIDRIVADGMDDGTAAFVDGQYTKRIMDAGFREAAARQDADRVALVELGDAIQAALTAEDPIAVLERLPADLRGSTSAIIDRSELRLAGDTLIAARRAMLKIDLDEESATASLDRIIAATKPQVIAVINGSEDARDAGEAPSTEAASILHVAAAEELAAAFLSTEADRRAAQLAVATAIRNWKLIVDAPSLTTTEIEAAEGTSAETRLGASIDTPEIAHSVAPADSPAASKEVVAEFLPEARTSAIEPGQAGRTPDEAAQPGVAGADARLSTRASKRQEIDVDGADFSSPESIGRTGSATGAASSSGLAPASPPETPRPPGPIPALPPDAEHPDDAERRKRWEKRQKQKRQRQAVLAKLNKGRGI